MKALAIVGAALLIAVITYAVTHDVATVNARLEAEHAGHVQAEELLHGYGTYQPIKVDREGPKTTAAMCAAVALAGVLLLGSLIAVTTAPAGR